jgi:hypothetical protein
MNKLDYFRKDVYCGLVVMIPPKSIDANISRLRKKAHKFISLAFGRNKHKKSRQKKWINRLETITARINQAEYPYSRSWNEGVDNRHGLL